MGKGEALYSVNEGKVHKEGLAATKCPLHTNNTAGHPQSQNTRNNKSIAAQTSQPLSGRETIVQLKIQTKLLASWGRTNEDGLRVQAFPVSVAGQRLRPHV